MDNLDYLKPSLQRRQKRRDKRLGEELIECSRYSSKKLLKGGYKNKVKKQEYAHAKQHESMKFMHEGGTKNFTDNLEPLTRFLERHIGKNWNKLYKELCSKLDKRTVADLHVFNHLWDFVRIHVRIENKKVFYIHYGDWRLLESYRRWPRFYVHPKTGQLCKAPQFKRK